jgi:hypothetical protein
MSLTQKEIAPQGQKSREHSKEDESPDSVMRGATGAELIRDERSEEGENARKEDTSKRQMLGV